MKTVSINIPSRFDQHGPLVTVRYADDEDRPCIQTINDLAEQCYDDDLLAWIMDAIEAEQDSGRSQADMDADEGDRRYHSDKEEGRTR